MATARDQTERAPATETQTEKRQAKAEEIQLTDRPLRPEEWVATKSDAKGIAERQKSVETRDSTPEKRATAAREARAAGATPNERVGIEQLAEKKVSNDFQAGIAEGRKASAEASREE